MKTLRILLVTLLFFPALGFSGEKELKNALAKAQYMLRQANAEKVSLEKEKRELQKSYDNFKNQVEKDLRAEENSNKKKSNQLNAKIDAYKEKLNEFKESYMTLRNQHIELKQERASLAGSYELEKKKFSMCVENNRKLFEVNKEILGEYENKGFFSVLRQREPLMGLSRVQIENLVQEYQYENEDLLVSDF